MELIDAVKAAISGETPTETPNEPIITAEVSDASANSGDAGDSGDGSGVVTGENGADDGAPTAAADAAAGTEADGAGGGEKDGVVRARDGQGRFVKADGTVDADQKAKKGEPGYVAEPELDPATGKPKVAAPAKAPDPINDPAPAGLSQKATERFQTLVKTAKDLTSERDQATADRKLLVDQVESTGATPEQYVETLGILRDINSGNPQAEERAFEYLTKATAALGARLGKAPPGVDPLTGHQDLIQEVIEGKLTRPRAEELAAQRRTTAAQQTRSQVEQTTQQANEAQAQALTQGTAALNALEQRLKTEDPAAFALKRAAVIKLARPVLATIRPNQWAATFESMYRNLPTPAPAARPAIPAAGAPGARPAQQPLRGKPNAGAQRPAPKNELDAVRQSLGLS